MFFACLFLKESNRNYSISLILKYLHNCTLYFCTFLNLSYFLLLGCQQGVTPFLFPDISLSIVDIGVTDVALRLTLTKTNQSQLISVERNGKEVYRFFCSGDSIFYDENLEPNLSYSYRAFLFDQGKKLYGSEDINITTMDTTSHDFSWEVINYGNLAMSVFNDAWIVNENEIWAFGNILDSRLPPDTINGNVNTPITGAKWDGTSWRLFRVYTQVGDATYPIAIRGAWRLSDKSFWFATGSVDHWRGNGIAKLSLLRDVTTEYLICRIWASSDSSVYAVGTGGYLIRYDGEKWYQYETDFKEEITDIWGVNDETSGEKLVMCTVNGSWTASSYDAIIKVEDNTFSEIPLPQNSYYERKFPNSVWFKNSNKIYISGGGVFYRNINGIWKEERYFTENDFYYQYRIRGSDYNNIFVAQESGRISHFNGVSWKTYNVSGQSSLYGLSIYQNIVVAVGLDGQNANIVVGRRED
jgi:hypothetical protein